MSEEAAEPKPEPIKLEKPALTPAQVRQQEIEQIGIPLFEDMESIVSAGALAAKKEEQTIKEKARLANQKARDLVWKYVSNMTDKNLALIYKSYDSVKMVGNLPYEYVKYAIIQRFIDRALEEGKPVTAPVPDSNLISI